MAAVQPSRTRVAVVVFVVAVAVPAPAAAVDAFEIQVYDDSINRPWEPSLELHLNSTVSGRKTPDYAGEVPPQHTSRMTLEAAVGLTTWLEAGLYLHYYVTPDSGGFGGFKLRAKLLVPERLKWPVIVGLNIEVGWLPHALEANAWAMEYRPILGWRSAWVLVAFNPILGHTLVGKDRFRPEFEPAAKFAVNTQHGFALGLEYYGGVGFWGDGFAPLRAQEHQLFAVFDLTSPARTPKEQESPWELNAGVGYGLTAGTSSRWVLKMIVGRSF